MFYQINTGVAQGGISSNTSCSSGSPSGCRRLFSLLSRNICRGGGSGHPVLCSFHIFFAGKPSDRLRCLQSPALLPPLRREGAACSAPCTAPAVLLPTPMPARVRTLCRCFSHPASAGSLEELGAGTSSAARNRLARGTGKEMCSHGQQVNRESSRAPCQRVESCWRAGGAGLGGSRPPWPGAGVSLSGRRERWL